MSLISISGIADSRVAPVAAHILTKKSAPGLILVSSQIAAKRLAEDLAFFISRPIIVLSEEEENFLGYEAKNRDAVLTRLRAMKHLAAGDDCIILAPVSAALKKLPPKQVYLEKVFSLRMGDMADLAQLAAQLAAMGYERVALAEAKGEFSIRGDILDIYPPDASNPYRIEFFDDMVDSIRYYDADTQRSLEAVASASVYPALPLIRDEAVFRRGAEKIRRAYDSQIKKFSDKTAIAEDEKANDRKSQRENLARRRDVLLDYIESGSNIPLLENYISYFYEEPERLWDYAGRDTVIMLDDPDRLYERADGIGKDLRESFAVWMESGMAVPADCTDCVSGKTDLMKLYGCRQELYLFMPFAKTIKGVERLDRAIYIQSKQPPVFGGHMDYLETELKRYVAQGYHVTLVCVSDERIENLRDFLSRIGLEEKVRLQKGSLTAGIEFPTEKICYMRDSDIFVSQKRASSRRRSRKSGEVLQSFSDLHKGDYVVHENHGIGKFLGIEQLDVQGIRKDYLKIRYAGEDVLYIPVEQMDLIQKYVGSEGSAPKINRLDGTEWKKAKTKAKQAIAEMAKELLEVTARRKIARGYAFSPDTVWQKEFEDSFPFTETDDQLRCIEEIKADMEREEPMDRLLCGDVGFGKTEVAARALFKCLTDGKQAAVLVPTTILANQHYYTLKERFERFPFTVDMMSRFRSDKQLEAAAEGIASGRVDMVIGTHRILSKDVRFKDLGLLVIDEEQRFGVQHKEKIKMLKENVDVLTLSATPIPRTLHMSMSGLKNMSLIEEPPEERYPVQTYVLEQDEDMIRNAIEKELSRDGQVYVVTSRIAGIQKVASMIEQLVPEARIAVGHGRMNETTLENVMMDFIRGEANVLVATTIIESGIDIPNVNTILILDADRFGLSQLYQLRGRVGRSNRIAYAYLMYQKDKVLTEVAEKRLRAIREFTEFGAGFKVAMRDLEIRGAGNLLGTEQSGHMMMIGYELYCKLVDEAIRALGGEVINPDRSESSVELSVTAFIPDRYISDEALKLQMYKRIASVNSREDESDITDELTDRFGDIPRETMALLKVSRIRALAEKLAICRVHEDGNKVVFDFAQIPGEDGVLVYAMRPEYVANVCAVYGMRVLVHGGAKPFIRFLPGEKNRLEEIIKFLETMEKKPEA